MDSNASQAADADLAIAVAAGDRKALAAIFDRYAPRLLAFSQSMLHNRADAEDCLQDIFILTATRISGLREPDRLRSWLFAIARHECLRRLDRKSREVLVDAVPDEYRPDGATAAADSPAAAALDNELATLLADAIAGLADRDRLVLDLADRQGLATDEVAAALSMSPSSAYKLLTRARVTARKSIGALLVARTGRENCPELDALLGSWTGSMTPLLRKRVARHIEECSLCQEQEKRVASPAALLGAGTAFAMPIPIGLRSHILDTAYEAQTRSIVAPPADPWAGGWPPKSPNLGGGRVFGTSGPGGPGPGGGGRAGESDGHRGRGPALAVAAAVAVLLVIGAIFAIGRPGVSPEAIRGPLPATSFPAQSISSPSSSGSQSSSESRSSTTVTTTTTTSTTVPDTSKRTAPTTKKKAPVIPTTTAPKTRDAGPTVSTVTTSEPGTTDSPSTDPSTTASTSSEPTTSSTASASTSSSTTARTTATTSSSTRRTTTTPTTTRTTPTTTRTTPTTTSTSARPAPQITGMSVACTAVNGTPILTWTTINTDSVSLSIDNPGVVGSYGTGYPSSDELELPPNGCDPTQGTQTYTIYAISKVGPTAQQTINWVPPAAPTIPTTPPPIR